MLRDLNHNFSCVHLRLKVGISLDCVFELEMFVNDGSGHCWVRLHCANHIFEPVAMTGEYHEVKAHKHLLCDGANHDTPKHDRFANDWFDQVKIGVVLIRGVSALRH